MTNPEFGKKNEFVRQKSTKWNNISDDIIFQQSELKVTADSASERSIEQARSQVIEAFSKAQPRTRSFKIHLNHHLTEVIHLFYIKIHALIPIILRLQRRASEPLQPRHPY